MPAVAKTLLKVGSRLGATAQNALEVARFGGFDTDEDASPCDVVTEQRVYRLRHYFPGAGGGPVVLLVRSEERRVGKECRSRWSPYH